MIISNRIATPLRNWIRCVEEICCLAWRLTTGSGEAVPMSVMGISYEYILSWGGHTLIRIQHYPKIIGISPKDHFCWKPIFSTIKFIGTPFSDRPICQQFFGVPCFRRDGCGGKMWWEKANNKPSPLGVYEWLSMPSQEWDTVSWTILTAESMIIQWNWRCPIFWRCEDPVLKWTSSIVMRNSCW